MFVLSGLLHQIIFCINFKWKHLMAGITLSNFMLISLLKGHIVHIYSICKVSRSLIHATFSGTYLYFNK